MYYLRQYNGLFLSAVIPNGGYLFYAAFIPGLRELIEEFVRKRLHDVIIHQLFDGAILFETSLSYDRLNFLCFNNIFAVISVMEYTAPGGAAPEVHIHTVVQNGLSPTAEKIIAHNNKKFRTFRVVISRENKPSAIDEKLRYAAEQYIAKLSGLKISRAGPDAEFWFLYRSEGFSFFMKRLTMRPSWEKSLHPGELPPPLAWTLCRLANLKHSDTVLDPFCGYGSIPRAALDFFHIKQFIACDLDKKAAAYTAARHRFGNFVLHKADFRSLTAVLPEKSVDVIITDPPWGCYQDIPVAQLYGEMFNIFDKLLKANGRMVILSGKTDVLLHAAEYNFVLQKNIHILLSGKKSAIYLFVR